MSNNNDGPVYSTMDNKPPCAGTPSWTYVGGCPGIDWEVASNNCSGYRYSDGTYHSCAPIYPGDTGYPIPPGATTMTTGCE